jgi:sRNA-binding carbon storage regulator CsrA
MLLIQRSPASEEREGPDNSIWVGDSLVTLIRKDGRNYLAVRAPMSIGVMRAELVDNHDTRAQQVRENQAVEPMIIDGQIFTTKKPKSK